MADRATVDRMLAGWPNRPKLAANRTIKKYGLPNEATAARLIWHNKAPFKRIMVVREEIPHQFRGSTWTTVYDDDQLSRPAWQER